METNIENKPESALTTRVSKWREICCAQASSGKSMQAYGSEHGIKAHQIGYWHKRLKELESKAEAGANLASKPKSKFVELRLPQTIGSSSAYIIKLGNGRSLELSHNYRADQVKELINILE